MATNTQNNNTQSNNTQSSKRSPNSRNAPAPAVVERRTRRITLPVLNRTVEVPSELVPYYLGLGAMAAIELIEWPVALIIAAGHTIATRSRNEALREIAGGVEAGG